MIFVTTLIPQLTELIAQVGDGRAFIEDRSVLVGDADKALPVSEVDADERFELLTLDCFLLALTVSVDERSAWLLTGVTFSNNICPESCG